MKLQKRSISAFQKKVYAHYRAHGRDFPWRKTQNPYRILVSEIMLQQTQADRVTPKYQAFLKAFPTVEALAKASLADVLRAWQGLGYNRRARALHACARAVMSDYKGFFPKNHAMLMKLPGIGPYTAGAILAFAYNIPVAIIETNIRTVYLHEFYNDKNGIADSELISLIETTLDQENPREWYAALMSYGVYIKKQYGNASTRSKHYTRQSKFEGSDRQIRGAIIRHLTARESATLYFLTKEIHVEKSRVLAQLAALKRDGLIIQKNSRYYLMDE